MALIQNMKLIGERKINMLYPISKVSEINWFRKCVGCIDNSATTAREPKECDHCNICPYAVCGSHESHYQSKEN